MGISTIEALNRIDRNTRVAIHLFTEPVGHRSQSAPE